MASADAPLLFQDAKSTATAAWSALRRPHTQRIRTTALVVLALLFSVLLLNSSSKVNADPFLCEIRETCRDRRKNERVDNLPSELNPISGPSFLLLILFPIAQKTLESFSLSEPI